MTHQLRPFEIADAKPEIFEPLLDHLSSSRRVYRSPGEGFVILSSSRPGCMEQIPLGLHAALGRTLTVEGLVELVSDNGGILGILAKQLSEARLGAILSCPTYSSRLSHIQTIVKLPTYVFSADRRRVVPAAAGYDPVRRAVYVGSAPTPAPCDPAYPLLRRWATGLSWADPSGPANFLGFALACLARPDMDEFPALVVDAERKKAGKTRLLQGLHYFLTGAAGQLHPWTGDEGAQQASLTPYTQRPGPNMLLFDNVRAKQGQSRGLRSSLLSIAAGGTVSVKALYKGFAPIYSPIFCFSMNGARVESDLHDKVVRVRLEKYGRDPIYFDPCPFLFGQEHHLGLRAEAHHLLTALELPPICQPDPTLRTRFGDFERLAVASARVLGLEPCYDQEAVRTTDALLEEFVHVVLDRKLHTFLEVVDEARGTEELAELREFLRTVHRSREGQADSLRQFVETEFVGRALHVTGLGALQVGVDMDEDGRYTVRIELFKVKVI